MRKKVKNSFVHIYTGNGKGKTTAALGLALRAAGAGLNVYIQQFIKGGEYCELKALKKIKNIRVEQCGRGCFIKGKPVQADMAAAEKGLMAARRALMSDRYNLVILDEINVALRLGLVAIRDVLDMIRDKHPAVELVLTGRYCPRLLIEKADLVTEMREIKHPYRKGVLARRGIEC